MRRHVGLRVGLGLLAVAQGAGGLTQLVVPRWFYVEGPWVAMLPPYNEHLMRDLGAATLAYVLPLAVAAFKPDPLLVRTALAATLVFTIGHFAFHATHLEHYAPDAALAQTLTLGIGVALPIVLLVAHERSLRPPRRMPPDGKE